MRPCPHPRACCSGGRRVWWWSLVVVVRVEGGGGGGGDEGHCGGGKRVPGVPHAELFLLAIYKLGCTSQVLIGGLCEQARPSKDEAG